MSLRKVLIANRGEIAVRIARACRELAIPCVAVYSEADRGAPHVAASDEAVHIGPAAASDSYLNADRLLEACVRTGCDSVHPGYGFLAENAKFAARIEQAGLTFIGPPAAAIAEMGDKTVARRRMTDSGVPVVPGSGGPLASAEEALSAAERAGFPVLLKAAAGGGGKGMRVVERAPDVARAFDAASREAGQAFGDDRVYVEKYLENPRHVEVQILADRHGTVLHLGERECSIQRRHQKLIEEAPAPGLPREVREELGNVACAAARAVGYVGAGTVEFLLQESEFYFLEMNTRIQVEHPVTELVTGVDIVQWQLRIAAGERLTLPDSVADPVGHAIECRISGEDPYGGFLPSTGIIRGLDLPGGPGVRWDGGVVVGSEVGLDYDPLLGKLIVLGATRAEAIVRMRRALDELALNGVRTTIPFHRAVMDEPDYLAGRVSVRYVEQHPELTESGAGWPADAAVAVAAVLEHRFRDMSSPRTTLRAASMPATERSAWQRRFEADE
ncbi:MAG: acetyl-CoA carboxylase biotin carboxylase subunit [Gemmatimonadota bacterium]|nr:acetyl-CoA carboxylase biotin carboxylase subunit [Gemmatimonadota bacterium]